MAFLCPLKFRLARLALWVLCALLVAVDGLVQGSDTVSAAVTVVLNSRQETRSFREDVWLHSGDAFDLIDKTGGAMIYPTTYSSQAFRFINGKCDVSQPVNYVEIYLDIDKNHVFWNKKSAASHPNVDNGNPSKGNHTPVPTRYRFTSPSSDETVPDFCFIFVIPPSSSEVGEVSSELPQSDEHGPGGTVVEHSYGSADISKISLQGKSSLSRKGTTEEQKSPHTVAKHTIEKTEEAPQRRLHPDFAFDEDPDENESEDTVFAIINDEERAYMFRRLRAVDADELDSELHGHMTTLVVHSIRGKRKDHKLRGAHSA
ncbi:hypothetical protein TGPRC2_229230 [Toxoplasma gondii TgCatPRC2]|uniref:Toxoplasma gondii family A protein n=1 Tax=Toxoplasma gondii TgCatPRC2 TaxID=1130821 RepID=A0A151HEG9_TOXGO|nr:hypothetical protein TGPRC2_229230 [Toxoplasma gondii TgCatPRC2]